MIIASCRKYFDSNKFLSADLQYRDYSASSGPRDLALPDLQAKARDRHVCILVHGYSNPLPGVIDAYTALQTSMKTFGIIGPANYGLVVGFTWPGWRGPQFPFARRSANNAGRYLLQLISALRSDAHSLDIQTHSLGARVALGALRNPKKAFVDNLLLSAPAVDNTSFQPGREFHNSLDACNRCFVYHSDQDDVLRRWFPAGDFINSACPALGLNGPRRSATALKQHPNLYVINCSACVSEHSAYRRATPYYAHWAQVLSGAPLPRTETLSPSGS